MGDGTSGDGDVMGKSSANNPDTKDYKCDYPRKM